MYRLFINGWTQRPGRIENDLVDVVDGIRTSAKSQFIFAPAKSDGSPSKNHVLVVIEAEQDYPWDAIEKTPGVYALPAIPDYKTGVLTRAESVVLNAKLAEYGEFRVTEADRYDLAMKKLAQSIEPAHTRLDKHLRGERKQPSSRGTFTDDFTAGADEFLDARTGWTLADAIATEYIQVQSATGVIRCVANNRAAYVCTDQGSADNYTQGRLKTLTGMSTNAVATRIVARTDWVGWYCGGAGSAGLRIAKCVSNTITNIALGQGADESVYRLEVSGSDADLYEDGSPFLSATYSENTTETSQGLVSDTSNANDWLDEFEAGVLGGGGSFQAAWAVGATQTMVGGMLQ